MSFINRDLRVDRTTTHILDYQKLKAENDEMRFMIKDLKARNTRLNKRRVELANKLEDCQSGDEEN